MSARGRELAARREQLLLRSERLRRDLRASTRELERGWQTVDRGIAFARSKLMLPAIVAGGLLVVLVRPSRLIRIAGRALMIWPVVRPLLPIVWSLVGAAKDARRTNPSA
ncbi:MAG: YqjK family protein [Myxococcota bacterium]